MPEKYRMNELGRKLSQPLSVVSAAVQAVRRLPENKHLLQENILVRNRIHYVPESHLQPLIDFFEEYATIQTHCKEYGLTRGQRIQLYERAGKGDLSQHAIRQHGMIFLTREAMKAAEFIRAAGFERRKSKKPKERKTIGPPPRETTPKKPKPPDYEEKEYFQLDKSWFSERIAAKLGRNDFIQSRGLIDQLIAESGGHDTKFAHALSSAVDAYKAEELHNLVLRLAERPAQLRRALLNAYAKRYAKFRKRTDVPHDDPLKQATDDISRVYG